jgi:hypothetical protein
MTTLDDDESLERELFTRRERALAAAIPARVPSLEGVLRAAGAESAAGTKPTPRSNVVPFATAVTNDRARRGKPGRRMMGAVLLVSACAAAMVAIGPQLRQLVVGAPEATIVPEPAPRSEEPAGAPSASMMPAVSSPAVSSPAAPSQVASSVHSDVCGGDPGESADTCSMSCEAESSP